MSNSSSDERLNLRDVQQLVDGWIRSNGGYYGELTNLARLTEEVGELARIIARTRGEIKTKAGDDVSSDALSSEMGDVLFVLACLANQMDVDLQTSLNQVLEKYRIRHTKLRGTDPEIL